MCFSLEFLKDLLVWAVILGALLAILKLLIPLALSWLGGPGTVLAQVINIIIWAAIVIFVIVVAFSLLSCLGGIHVPRLG